MQIRVLSECAHSKQGFLTLEIIL